TAGRAASGRTGRVAFQPTRYHRPTRTVSFQPFCVSWWKSVSAVLAQRDVTVVGVVTVTVVVVLGGKRKARNRDLVDRLVVGPDRRVLEDDPRVRGVREIERLRTTRRAIDAFLTLFARRRGDLLERIAVFRVL